MTWNIDGIGAWSSNYGNLQTIFFKIKIKFILIQFLCMFSYFIYRFDYLFYARVFEFSYSDCFFLYMYLYTWSQVNRFQHYKYSIPYKRISYKYWWKIISKRGSIIAIYYTICFQQFVANPQWIDIQVIQRIESFIFIRHWLRLHDRTTGVM